MYLHPVDRHPIPFEQEGIDEIWELHEYDREPPSVDAAHEDHVKAIAKWDEWHVFRPLYPFGHGDVYFWNSSTGEGFRVRDEEGSWHALVNLFAEIVDAECDCRDAEYSNSLMPSGSYDQRCENCGRSWSVG